MNSEILERIIDTINSSKPCVLVTPVTRSGSVPCPEHASLIVTEDGTEGTVGGGILEARSLKTGLSVLKTGEMECNTERLDASDAAENGMLCGGSVTFLFEPIHRGNPECWQKASRAAGKRVNGAFIIEIPRNTPRKTIRQWVGENDLDELDIKTQDAVRLSIRMGRRQMIALEDHIRFIDPLVLAEDLLVFGGGHVAHALVPIAAAIGYRVWIIDDRESFVTEERFPAAYARIAREPSEAVCELPTGSHVHVVVMTRGHKDDKEVIEKLLDNSYRYIGMIGSLRKKKIIWEKLLSDGADPHRLTSISCPIGLPIGGSTPAEIAISIAAELLTIRYGVSRHAAMKQKSDYEENRSVL